MRVPQSLVASLRQLLHRPLNASMPTDLCNMEYWGPAGGKAVTAGTLHRNGRHRAGGTLCD
jgi:hypothetical protein